MTNDGDHRNVRDDRDRLTGSPLAVLVARTPSCQVVDLVEDWDRWTRAEAARLAADLRRR